MYSNSSGGRLERFLEGKGFYIVLFLCAAVIGMSVWAMRAGTETVYEELEPVDELQDDIIETVLIEEPMETVPIIIEEREVEADDYTDTLYPEGATAQETAAVYLWPVSGSIDRRFSTDTLSYDDTLGDWRTHAAVDIEASEGTGIVACHSGTVANVYRDSLLGTVMVIDHGEGLRSVYGNLAPETAVQTGAWVAAGSTIGTVGSSAIGESRQQPHLHFAMTRDGYAVDPMQYLGE